MLKMKEYDAKNPLEVQIIKNLSFLDLGRNRLWCKIVVIMPVEKDLNIKQGMIKGFRDDSLKETFTRFYLPNEEVNFEIAEGGFTGTLKVGRDVYHAESKAIAGRPIMHETKQFPKGHGELWDYIKND